ncbi:MAG: methylmalonyl Co-A mutase-associated GTPase MeaB [Bacteroidetes bacterium]|nr:methylmalonyl Co-A mutase-associated GTPase MeaB [Bacteroidota bacterium]
MSIDDTHDEIEREAHSGAESGEEGTARGSEGRLEVRPGVTSPGNLSPSLQRRTRRELSIDEHVEGILSRDRVVLGKTITLIESLRPEHTRKALEVMERLLPHTGKSVRVGITGVPGVGKSTFIESLGSRLTDEGHRIAVLAIDPSSRRSSGSIMGDKTRMEKLSVDPDAFIRPSPSAGSLGGVARKTREAMLVCEAAGYDVVFVETVGVGQSETMVHSMVDFFLLLMLAGAGDQLQGIKRGIMELADAVVINKADGDNARHAQRAKHEYEMALHLMKYPTPDWSPPVLTCSALTGMGIEEIWQTIKDFRARMTENGWIEKKRREQALAWMHDSIAQSLQDRFRGHAGVAHVMAEMEKQVSRGELPPLLAAQRLLETFFNEEISTL